MAEAQIWKQFLWRWRYWVAFGVMACFPLTHILFPTLFPDWMVHVMEMMIEALI